ncbi:5-(carboxyamino)imidazole ribonucleotide mutase [Aquiluna sp. KACHI24]|uniref:5-(carboxyamino)imidazole ribonucleotide mutase n=1 Tax=Aquiluna sp. KACHI24 TaxID=2968831 RepID=UPI0021FC8C6A|nr:5-(carboxyamino)imidazole ribonucleotide mutase [Aquiluna sp. KACHI24]BDP99941.1 N5-carboxyaminoimidazole ribonucleotide mutase [Aquiluna sp. KACHI24]
MTKVAIVMGSDSDWRVMEAAHTQLAEFGISAEVQVLSAHRTPEQMLSWGSGAAAQGFSVIIAGAGGAAHLPGMIASVTSLPVIGVPVSLGKLDGMDSLLSIVQMPAGVPVATVSIDGAKNAALLALRILGASDAALREKLDEYRESLKEIVAQKNSDLRSRLQ